MFLKKEGPNFNATNRKLHQQTKRVKMNAASIGMYLVLKMLLYRPNDQYIQTTLYLTEMRKITISQAKYLTVALAGHSRMK